MPSTSPFSLFVTSSSFCHRCTGQQIIKYTYLYSANSTKIAFTQINHSDCDDTSYVIAFQRFAPPFPTPYQHYDTRDTWPWTGIRETVFKTGVKYINNSNKKVELNQMLNISETVFFSRFRLLLHWQKGSWHHMNRSGAGLGRKTNVTSLPNVLKVSLTFPPQ